MNNLNNVNYHGFPYLFLSISQEGKAMASNLLFYGPWDESLALSEIIAALKLKTNLLSLPNGATVATISNNGDLIEYYIWGDELYPKTAGILDNDIKVVFAYLLNNILDPSEIQIPSIDLAESYLDLVNKFANSSWTLTLNSNIDYTTHVLWQSYGVFKVDRKTGRYLLLNLDGTTEGSPSWSRPFMSGGGSSSSTSVADNIYRCSLSNYNVSIPKNVNGYITNKALKLATYTTFLVFHNGVPVVSDISDIALQNSFYPVTDGEGNGFTLKYGSTKVLYEGSEIIVRTYWLEWANTPENLTTEERDNYSKSIYDDVVLSKLIKNVGINLFFSILYVATIDGNTISIAQLLKFIDKEFSYKLLVSPNMVNIPKSNLAPAILCTANKYYWDGNTIEYIKDTDSKHYYKLSTPTAEEWSTDGGSEVAPTQDGSYMFSQEQVNGLIAGNDNYDYITAELIAEDKETREDIQSVPLFFQSLLRTELLSNFDSDIIGSSVNVGKDLVGDNGANTSALRALTEGALTISHKNIPLLPKQYRITSVTDVSHTDVIEDRRSRFVLIDDDGTILDGSDESHTYDPTKYIHYPKKFYCSKLAGITSVEIAFEYIDPEDGISDIKEQETTKIYTGVQGLKINVLEGNEFYQLRIFPSLMRIQSNGSSILETILLIVREVVGTTVTLLDDFSDFKLELSLKKPGDNEFDTYSYTNINSSGIINLLNYDNKETPGDKINWLLYKDGLSYFTLYKIVNDNGIYCDLEDFDIFLMPKDGEDGDSAYTLRVPSTLVIDDDSTLDGIKNASIFTPVLLYGNSEIDDFSIEIESQLFYDGDDILTTDLFELCQDDEYYTNNEYYLLAIDLNGNLLTENPFLNKSYYGNITYVAKERLNIVARFLQFVKIFNYSDGLNYILNVSPNVLYKNSLDTLVTENVNTNIRFQAILNSGLTNEVLSLISDAYYNDTYIALKFISNESVLYTKYITQYDYDDFSEIDFSDTTQISGTTYTLKSLCDASSVIICDLYVNNIVLKSETIYFSKQGNTGESVDSGYSIHLDNDNVIIDDDTSNEDLEIASETKITVTHNGHIVMLDSISDDSNLQITLSSKLKKLFVDPILSVEGDTYHLQWKENHTPVSEVSGTITVSLTFTDELDSNVTISRKLNILIKDFSDGSVYKLRTIPNAIVVNPDRTSNIKNIELSVDKIKDGIPTKVNLTTSGITFSVSSIRYINNTTTYNDISNAISYSISSTDYRKLLLIKDEWLKNPTWIGLQIYAKKSNTIIDAETISYITDGQDGNGVEYIYYRTNTIDSNIDANKLYGFVVTDGEYIVRKNNYKYDDFLPIISSTETYGDGTKVSEEDLSKFVYWTDEPSGVDSTHQYEYLATRKYNGKTKAWGAFSVPVICNKYVTPSMNLLLDNEIIIVDDNATSAILKEVSLTSFKLFNGLNDISSNVSIVTDPNKDYLLTVTEEGGDTTYFNIIPLLSPIDHKLYIYLSLKDNKTLLPGQYHNIYYRVTDKNNTLVAEKVQKVKVTNFSEDGSSYKLQLSNNILYRQFNGNTLSELPDEDITVRVQKIAGDLSDVLYEKINCDESELLVCCLIKNKLGEIERWIYDSTSNDDTIFVIPGRSFNTCNHKNSTINVCLYATLHGSLLTLLDRQPITFNVVGLSGSSAITATITNDSILIDDLSSDAIIKEASTSRITLYRSSNDIISTEDYSISGSVNDGQAHGDSAFDVLIILSLDQTYYESVLRLKEGKQLVQGTYTITYTISSNRSDFPTFLKYLRLKVTDVTEDGSTYKLLVEPDIVNTEWDDTNNLYIIKSDTITITGLKISTDGVHPITFNTLSSDGLSLLLILYYEEEGEQMSENITDADSYQDADTVYTTTTTNMDPSLMLETTKYWIALLLYNNIVIDQEVISINRPGKTGAKGDKGCSIRTFYLSGGHPKNGFTYQDGTSDFLDYIVFDGTLTQLNVYNVYKCKKSYTYTSQSPSISSDTIHWLLIDSGQDAFYQNLIALNAHVENLVATTIDSTGIELYNDLLDHTTKYGLFKAPTNNTDYPLWLGKDNEGKPKFSVDQDGNLTCNNVKSFFKGSVITNELEVTLKLLALDKNYNADDTNEVLLYINPLEYGLNVRITNGKKDGDHIQWEDVGIKDPLFPGDISLSVIYLYIDLPAYYLNGTVNHDELYNDYTSYETLELRGLPADDRSDHLSDFYSVSVPYIKYVDTFIEKQLHLSIDLTDVNVLIRGCLSSYYENNMKNIQYNTLLENAFNNLLINDFQPYYYQSGSGFDTDKPIVYPYGDIYIKDNNKMLDVMCGNLKQKYVFICKLITYENSDAVYWLSLTLLNHESLNYREYANTDPTFPIDRIKNEAFGINSNSQNNYDNITPEDINNYYYYYYEDNTANNP